MKHKSLLAGLLLALAPAFASAGDDLAAAIKQAKEAEAKANELGYEWRDTAKFLKLAEEEKDAGKAMKLAKKALKQAEDAQKQAAEQKDAGPRF